MELVVIYIVVYTIGIVLQTGVLATSLFLVEDIQESSFKELGAVGALARCAGISVVTILLSLVPFGFLLALVVWFLGFMVLFQKSFGQTVILFLVNGLVSIALNGAIHHFLSN